MAEHSRAESQQARIPHDWSAHGENGDLEMILDLGLILPVLSKKVSVM